MRKVLPNLQGKNFGAWKVIRKASPIGARLTYWLCQCACGVKRKVYGPSLTNGKSIECGHSRSACTTQRNIAAKKPLAERFWSRVNKHGATPSAEALRIHPEIMGTCCWEWTGDVYDGYGYLGGIKGTPHSVRAHRAAWFLKTGRWPELNALHKCDNRKCVRFSHLFEGTNQENTADQVAKGRTIKGENTNTAKLTDAQVKAIRKALGTGTSGIKLAKLYNVSQSTIYFIKRGETWKHLL